MYRSSTGDWGPLKESAHLKLKDNATSQFFKPRSVPFALKKKIAQEIRR